VHEIKALLKKAVYAAVCYRNRRTKRVEAYIEVKEWGEMWAILKHERNRKDPEYDRELIVVLEDGRRFRMKI
jgi:hypothetical protein